MSEIYDLIVIVQAPRQTPSSGARCRMAYWVNDLGHSVAPAREWMRPGREMLVSGEEVIDAARRMSGTRR